MSPFFYASELSDLNYLSEEESFHCAKVLRLKKGEKIHLVDGKGLLASAELLDVHSKKCQFNLLEKKKIPPRPYSVHLLLAPTKQQERMKWLVEKLVEIGIDTISFMHTHQSERIKINVEKVSKTAVQAMKQSQQAYLPKINEMTSFEKVVAHASEEVKLIAYVLENEEHIARQKTVNASYCIGIGPEGGFTKEEISLAAHHHFVPVSLGANRLRTETACMVACQSIHFIQQLNKSAEF